MWFSGSYSGGDVGGMYSSSYGSDYMPRGSDVYLLKPFLIWDNFDHPSLLCFV